MGLTKEYTVALELMEYTAALDKLMMEYTAALDKLKKVYTAALDKLMKVYTAALDKLMKVYTAMIRDLSMSNHTEGLYSTTLLQVAMVNNVITVINKAYQHQ